MLQKLQINKTISHCLLSLGFLTCILFIIVAVRRSVKDKSSISSSLPKQKEQQYLITNGHENIVQLCKHWRDSERLRATQETQERLRATQSNFANIGETQSEHKFISCYHCHNMTKLFQ